VVKFTFEKRFTMSTIFSNFAYVTDNGSGGSSAAPVTITTAATTTSAPAQCQTRWSSWINTDNPSSDEMEYEHWTAIQKLQFCPGMVSLSIFLCHVCSFLQVQIQSNFSLLTEIFKLQLLINFFMLGGRLDKIECVTVNGDIPYYSSGEQLTCYRESGLICRNADNFPVPCEDYKIRYHCLCRKYHAPPPQ
jgi:hypothetical protein